MIGPAFTAASVIYLIWYGWMVFVRDKGNPGGLGLAIAAICVIELITAARNLI